MKETILFLQSKTRFTFYLLNVTNLTVCKQLTGCQQNVRNPGGLHRKRPGILVVSPRVIDQSMFYPLCSHSMLSGKFAETKLKNDLVSVIRIHFRRSARGLLARAPFLKRIEQCLVIRPFFIWPAHILTGSSHVLS